MKRSRVCRVIGKDHRGYPVFILVEATTVYEAAAKAMDELTKGGNQPTDVEVEVYTGWKRFKVDLIQMSRWVVGYTPDESVGLRDLKRRLKALLEDALRR